MHKAYNKILTVRVSESLLKKAKKSGIPLAYVIRRVISDLATRAKPRLPRVPK